MKYTAPILVLVGDAKNLVLHNLGQSNGDPTCDIDNEVGASDSDAPELW
jgi:hypothetical protein